MKRFAFTLEAALEWRKHRMEAEQARLQSLEAERLAVIEAMRQVDQSWEQAQQQLLAAKMVDAFELTAIEGFHKASDAQRLRLRREQDRLERAVREQQGRLVEASRQYRLLEKLRQRRREEWQRAVDKQLEDEAGELYLAQWRSDE